MKRSTKVWGAAVALAIGLSGVMAQAAVAAASGAETANEHRVGHDVEKNITVPGSETVTVPGSEPIKEMRSVDVHLWYPADKRGLSEASRTDYRSELWGRSLPDGWDQLSWEVPAELAREKATLDSSGQRLPVIVFSHGSVNDPIDYAHTLERIAAAGFVVAAPSHTNNTQDDVRRDYVNAHARERVFDCKDGLPHPRKPEIVNGAPTADCSKASVPFNMADRVRDITYTLDWLEHSARFGERVDTEKVGVLGHSRGTVTALAAAGGSAGWGPRPSRAGARDGLQCILPAQALCWPGVRSEPRVGAIMGMAIGAWPVTFGADVSSVKVPSLLVAGRLDLTSPHDVSEEAHAKLASEDKAFVSLANATHRSFDSTYCAQTKSSGAEVLGADGQVAANPTLDLDRHTFRGIVAPGGGQGTSGRATQYCGPATFSGEGIKDLVASLPGGSPFPAEVPTTGLATDEVKEGMRELAAALFGTALKTRGEDGTHFTRYLAPKWLEKHALVDGMEGHADASATSEDAVCPPGQEVVCGD